MCARGCCASEAARCGGNGSPGHAARNACREVGEFVGLLTEERSDSADGNELISIHCSSPSAGAGS